MPLSFARLMVWKGGLEVIRILGVSVAGWVAAAPSGVEPLFLESYI
jgi:hypothetical protein